MIWYNILTDFINPQKQGGSMSSVDKLQTIADTVQELAQESTGRDRVRINISVSTKDVHTYDCTVESTKGMDHALAESDKLVQALEKRYPREVI